MKPYAAAPPSGPVSSQIGRYEALFKFAQGGMADVYVGRQASHGAFERPVAIKRMRQNLVEDDRFVEMFLDEARIAALVSSPNVVQTFDFGREEDGAPYIVMELVVGLSLSQILKACADIPRYIPARLAAEIIAQAASGLDDAHRATNAFGESLGLVHRDVSPQNVMIGIDGRVRIADFGVARALSRITQTETGEVKGKISYFSPEQACGDPVDHRSDIFALGVVAWETFTGQRLFQKDNPAAVVHAITLAPIASVHASRPDVPVSISDAIAGALARDVDVRTGSAADLATAIRRALADSRELVTAAELGAFVAEVGGQSLQGFRDKVHAAFRAEGPRSPLSDHVALDSFARGTPSRSRSQATSNPARQKSDPPSYAEDQRSGVSSRSFQPTPSSTSRPPGERQAPAPSVETKAAAVRPFLGKPYSEPSPPRIVAPPIEKEVASGEASAASGGFRVVPYSVPPTKNGLWWKVGLAVIILAAGLVGGWWLQRPQPSVYVVQEPAERTLPAENVFVPPAVDPSIEPSRVEPSRVEPTQVVESGRVVEPAQVVESGRVVEPAHVVEPNAIAVPDDPAQPRHEERRVRRRVRENEPETQGGFIGLPGM